MKKTAALILAVALFVLAGCGQTAKSNPVPTEKPKVTITTPKPTQKPFDPLDIPTIEVESTALSRIGYDDEHHVLLLQFKDSGVYYCYYDVPATVWREFKAAESYG